MFGAIRLQRPEVIRIPEFGAKAIEDYPVFLLQQVTDGLIQVPHQIADHPIAVEQRVIDVEQVRDRRDR
jgi:hypothetical protein